MDSTFHQFSKRIIIISLITAVLTFILTYIIPEKFISYSWPYIIIFFLSISLLVHRFLLKKSIDHQGKFINAFMLATTVKLLLYLAIILIYVLLNRYDAIGFIITFFSYYLIFTSFEIFSILKFLKGK
ncbi:MAG: hypothetical protein PF484_09435 [Bacteroidales bacterium]|jgi:hypothetical protein|nr:hypothetical protein [Bacteroidales bacterium]